MSSRRANGHGNSKDERGSANSSNRVKRVSTIVRNPKTNARVVHRKQLDGFNVENKQRYLKKKEVASTLYEKAAVKVGNDGTAALIAKACALNSATSIISADYTKWIEYCKWFAVLTTYDLQANGSPPSASTYYPGELQAYFYNALVMHFIRNGIVQGAVQIFYPMDQFYFPPFFAKWLQQTSPYINSATGRKFDISILGNHNSTTLLAATLQDVGIRGADGFNPAPFQIPISTTLTTDFLYSYDNNGATAPCTVANASANFKAISKYIHGQYTHAVTFANIPKYACSAELKNTPVVVSLLAGNALYACPEETSNLLLCLCTANQASLNNSMYPILCNSICRADSAYVPNEATKIGYLWQLVNAHPFVKGKTLVSYLRQEGFSNLHDIQVNVRGIDFASIAKECIDYCDVVTSALNLQDVWYFISWCLVYAFSQVPASCRAAGDLFSTTAPGFNTIPAIFPAYTTSAFKESKVPPFLAAMVAPFRHYMRYKNQLYIPCVYPHFEAATTPWWYTACFGPDPDFSLGNTSQYGTFTAGMDQLLLTYSDPSIYLKLTNKVNGTFGTIVAGSTLNVIPIYQAAGIYDSMCDSLTAYTGRWYCGTPRMLMRGMKFLVSVIAAGTSEFSDPDSGYAISVNVRNATQISCNEPAGRGSTVMAIVFRSTYFINIAATVLVAEFIADVNMMSNHTGIVVHSTGNYPPGSTTGQNLASKKNPVDFIAKDQSKSADGVAVSKPDVHATSEQREGIARKLSKDGVNNVVSKAKTGARGFAKKLGAGVVDLDTDLKMVAGLTELIP